MFNHLENIFSTVCVQWVCVCVSNGITIFGNQWCGSQTFQPNSAAQDTQPFQNVNNQFCYIISYFRSVIMQQFLITSNFNILETKNATLERLLLITRKTGDHCHLSFASTLFFRFFSPFARRSLVRSLLANYLNNFKWTIKAVCRWAFNRF